MTIPTRLPATLFDRAWAAAIPHPIGQHCVLSLSGRLDETRLARAVRIAFDVDPILGCRLVEPWFRPYWQRREELDRFFELRSTTSLDVDLKRFLDVDPDSCVRVLLLRGDTDVLCVKFDHLVGDAKALHEYMYLLADIYNRLDNNRETLSLPMVSGRRDLLGIVRRFSLRERWQIVRHVMKERRAYKSLGQWHYPTPAGAATADYLSWRLDAAQVKAIFDYGYKRRATVSQVLLAAFYLAARDVLGHSEDRPLPVAVSIDLRRYLPEARTASANFVGNAVVAIDPGSATVEVVVEQIQRQMKAQRKYLGLAVSFFPLEALPGVRHLIGLIPHGVTKRRRHLEEQSKLSGDHVPGILMWSNAGELDDKRLAFGMVHATDGFATAGVFRVPGLLAVGMCGFKGSLSLHLGCGSTALLKRVSDTMMQVLATALTSD